MMMAGLKDDLKKYGIGAAVLGGSLIIASIIVSGTLYKIKAAEDSITVTGSAKTTVKADLVKWRISISRTVLATDMKRGYSEIARDLSVVKNFFSDNNIAETDLVISPVFADKNYAYYKEGANRPIEYNLQQTIEVQSSDIEKITALSRDTKFLVDNSVIFSPQAPEYYFTGLANKRLDLLGLAVQDAKLRATKIAESGDRHVGSLKSTSVGVTQVTAKNSISDVNDYGAYDTQTIDKDIMITVRSVFNLR